MTSLDYNAEEVSKLLDDLKEYPERGYGRMHSIGSSPGRSRIDYYRRISDQIPDYEGAMGFVQKLRYRDKCRQQIRTEKTTSSRPSLVEKIELPEQKTDSEPEKMESSYGSPELVTAEEYKASKPQIIDPTADAIREKEQRDQERINRERRQYKANKILYFGQKYNRFAQYPFDLPDSSEYAGRALKRLSTLTPKNRNYDYGLEEREYYFRIWLTWISFNPNESHKKIRPVIRDFLWTCDSTLSEEEVYEAADELLTGKHGESDMLVLDDSLCSLTIEKTGDRSILKFEIMRISMPEMPENDSWYEEHSAERDPNCLRIENLIYEPIPGSKTVYKVTPLDPDKDFDVFMDIYGEEFETEDDAWDAWEEGYP